MKINEMSFDNVMHWIAQGAINITENNGEKFEVNYPTHKAMQELCRMVSIGLVSLTPHGRKYESTIED